MGTMFQQSEYLVPVESARANRPLITSTVVLEIVHDNMMLPAG